MEKVLLISSLLVPVFSFGVRAGQTDSTSQKWYLNNRGSFLELGYYSVNLKPMGMNDFHISDNSQFGLKATDPSSKESRYNIPIKEFLTHQIALNSGFTLRGRWYYTRVLQGTLGMSITHRKSGFRYLQASLGIAPVLYTYKRFRLSGNVELADGEAEFKLDHIYLLRGYHPTLHVNDFVVNPGNTLFFTGQEFSMNAGFSVHFAIAKGVFLFGSVNVNKHLGRIKATWFSSSASDGNELSMRSAAIVMPDLASTQHLKTNPNYVATGLSLQFGLSINLPGDNDQSHQGQSHKENEQSNETKKPAGCSQKHCRCCGQTIPE